MTFPPAALMGFEPQPPLPKPSTPKPNASPPMTRARIRNESQGDEKNNPNKQNTYFRVRRLPLGNNGYGAWTLMGWLNVEDALAVRSAPERFLISPLWLATFSYWLVQCVGTFAVEYSVVVCPVKFSYCCGDHVVSDFGWRLCLAGWVWAWKWNAFCGTDIGSAELRFICPS